MLITNYVIKVKNILTKKICIKKPEALIFRVILGIEITTDVLSNKILDYGLPE